MRTRSILRVAPFALCAAVVLSACAERVITGAAEPDRPRLTVVPTVAFDSIDSGWVHSCALTSGGLAYCWGRNNFAQLGDSSLATRTTPVAVRMPRDANGAVIPFAQISAGGSHSCAVDGGGQAWCWGLNADRRLGDSTTANPRKPIKVKPYGAIAFTQVAVGDGHTCGIDGSGDAYCWGANSYGQIGDSTTTFRYFPTAVAMPAGVSFDYITAGEIFSCALDGTGQAWCWGYGADGRTGDGSAFGEPIPSAVQQPSGVTFVALSGDYYHACGLTSGGQAYCWGVNAQGQLGDGTTTDRPTPVAVSQPGGVTFVRLATGADHSCGTTSAGQTYCWGGNATGQLGDGTNTQSLTPAAVSQPAGITFGQVRGGANFSCALDPVNDQAYCWGRNNVYQLGDGTTTDKNAPNAVSH